MRTYKSYFSLYNTDPKQNRHKFIHIDIFEITQTHTHAYSHHFQTIRKIDIHKKGRERKRERAREREPHFKYVLDSTTRDSSFFPNNRNIILHLENFYRFFSLLFVLSLHSDLNTGAFGFHVCQNSNTLRRQYMCVNQTMQFKPMNQHRNRKQIESIMR